MYSYKLINDDIPKQGDFLKKGQSVSLFRGFTWYINTFKLIVQQPVAWLLISIAIYFLSLLPIISMISSFLFAPLYYVTNQQYQGTKPSINLFIDGFKVTALKQLAVLLLLLINVIIFIALSYFILGGTEGILTLTRSIHGPYLQDLFDSWQRLIHVYRVKFASLICLWLIGGLVSYTVITSIIPIIVLTHTSFKQAFVSSFIGTLKNIFPILLFNILFLFFGYFSYKILLPIIQLMHLDISLLITLFTIFNLIASYFSCRDIFIKK